MFKKHIALVAALTLGGVGYIGAPPAANATAYTQCFLFSRGVNRYGWEVQFPSDPYNGGATCWMKQWQYDQPNSIWSGSGHIMMPVRTLQVSLNSCNGQNLMMDGVYGPATTAAVKAVQRAHHLTVDGIYGPATRSAMKWLASSGPGGASSCQPWSSDLD